MFACHQGVDRMNINLNRRVDGYTAQLYKFTLKITEFYTKVGVFYGI